MRDVPLPKAPRCHAGGCHGNGKGGIWLGKEGGHNPVGPRGHGEVLGSNAEPRGWGGCWDTPPGPRPLLGAGGIRTRPQLGPNALSTSMEQDPARLPPHILGIPKPWGCDI